MKLIKLKNELTEMGVGIGEYNEDQLQELAKTSTNIYDKFQLKDWHDKDKGGHGPNYKEWEGLSKAYFDVRKKIDDRKLKLRDERKAKDEKLKKEKTTKAQQIEETKKVDLSETDRVKLRSDSQKVISEYLRKKNYAGIEFIIYNTKHNAYKSYNKDGKFGGRLEGKKSIFTTAEVQTYERLIKEDKEHNTATPLTADNEVEYANLSKRVLDLVNIVDKTELVTKDGTPTGEIQKLRIAISQAYTGLPKGSPGRKFHQRIITKSSFDSLNSSLNGAENDVQNVLSKSHGVEVVKKEAERDMALNLQATVSEQFVITGFPNPGHAKLFKKMRVDFQLFTHKATVKHPEIFEQVTYNNRNLRMLVFDSYWNSQLVLDNEAIVEGAIKSITDAQKQQGWEDIIRSLIPIRRGKFVKEYDTIGGDIGTPISEDPPVITGDGEDPLEGSVITGDRIEQRLNQFSDQTSTAEKRNTVKILGRKIKGKTIRVSPMLSEAGEPQIVEGEDSLTLYVYSNLADEHGEYIAEEEDYEEDPQEFPNPENK